MTIVFIARLAVKLCVYIFLPAALAVGELGAVPAPAWLPVPVPVSLDSVLRLRSEELFERVVLVANGGKK